MPATPSPNYNDMQLLANDPTFRDRVKMALVAGCTTIKNEPVTTAFHRERETFVVACINSPDTYKILFANAAASDATCVADATVNGTVPLTSGNVGTQQALVTDAHMLSAMAAAFNTFFRTPNN